jgi:hypothetical protein
MSTGAGAIFGQNINPFTGTSQGGAPATGGSNQWMSYPSIPNFGAGGGLGSGATGAGGAGKFFNNQPGGQMNMGGNIFTAPTFDPNFTSSFYGMLQQLLGSGGGGSNLQNQLLSFLSGGQTNIPGASSLSSMAQTGNPISALPEWQKMIAAQQQNIQQNQAGLKEQFAFMGDPASSSFGTAESNYMQQTTKDQNALLAQLEQQSMESAMQRELSASTSLTGMAGAESQFLDSLFSGAATASPGLFDKHKGSLLGGIGSLIGAGASVLPGLSQLLKTLGIGGGGGGAAASSGGGSDLGGAATALGI